MPSPKILVVDDDPCFRTFLRRYLDRNEFLVECVATGDHGLVLCKTFQPDAVLLDWCLGTGLSGEDTLRAAQTQPQSSTIPFVVMSGTKQAPEDEVFFKQRGAAFFVDKLEISGSILNENIFLRRLRALILEGEYRRATASGGIDGVSSISLDPINRTVAFGTGISEALSHREFCFMRMLLQKHPAMTTRQEILSALFSRSRTEAPDLALGTFLRHLRNKLPPELRVGIETVRGLGYRLNLPAAAATPPPRACV